MKKLILIPYLVTVVLCPWGFANDPVDDEFSDEFTMLEEEFFSSTEKVAVTATKREKKAVETPSSITVITAEDIARSGAASIPELLRSVPGLHVAMASRGDINITSRGMNDWIFHGLLLLVDGRSDYADFFGAILWDMVIVELDEIERIEIIRGPGSALWGANATSGVINIITKTPSQVVEEGSSATVRTGTYGSTQVSAVYGAKLSEKLYTKFTFGWNQWNHFRNQYTDIRRNATGDAIGKGAISLEYQQSEDSLWRISAGIADGTGHINAGLTSMDRRGSHEFAKINWDMMGFRLQGFYNGYHQEVSGPDFDFEEDYVAVHSFDLSLERSDELEDIETIFTYGVSSRFNGVDTRHLLPQDETQMLYAGFIQGEKALMDDLTITMGFRVDSRPEQKGANFSPRVGLVYTPWEDHVFWASYGKAFQNTSMLYNFIDLNTSKMADVPGVPFKVPSFNRTLGNRDMDPQELVSWETGYRNHVFDRVHFNIDLFYNQWADLHDAFTVADLSGLPAVVTAETKYQNLDKAKTCGGETGVNVLICDWLTSYANYSYVSAWGDDVGFTPRNKANGGLLFDLDQGFKINMNFNYVEGSTNHAAASSLAPSKTTDSYFIVNGAITYTPPGANLSFSLNGFNVLHDAHVELPSSQTIGSLFLLGITYRF